MTGDPAAWTAFPKLQRHLVEGFGQDAVHAWLGATALIVALLALRSFLQDDRANGATQIAARWKVSRNLKRRAHGLSERVFNGRETRVRREEELERQRNEALRDRLRGRAALQAQRRAPRPPGRDVATRDARLQASETLQRTAGDLDRYLDHAVRRDEAWRDLSDVVGLAEVARAISGGPIALRPGAPEVQTTLRAALLAEAFLAGRSDDEAALRALSALRTTMIGDFRARQVFFDAVTLLATPPVGAERSGGDDGGLRRRPALGGAVRRKAETLAHRTAVTIDVTRFGWTVEGKRERSSAVSVFNRAEWMDPR